MLGTGMPAAACTFMVVTQRCLAGCLRAEGLALIKACPDEHALELDAVLLVCQAPLCARVPEQELPGSRTGAAKTQLHQGLQAAGHIHLDRHG